MTEAETAKTNDTKPSKSAKRKATKSLDRVAKAARDASEEARKRANDTVKATAEALDENPFGAIAGAIAVGAVAAALIPATQRELKALGPLADRLRGAALAAFDAARQAGTAELTSAGLTVAAASDGLGGIVGKLVKAVTAASSAAASSVKTEGETPAPPTK